MELDEFEERIGSLLDGRSGEGWKLLVEFLKERGVNRVAYHHLPPLGALDVSILRAANFGFPESAVQRYLLERRAGNTPVALYAQGHSVPIYWDEIQNLKELSKAEKDYLRAAVQDGLVNGCGLQVFGPNGRNGFLSLGFSDGVRRLPAADMRQVQLACQSAHLRYCEVLRPTLEPPPALSARESEVLGWVAHGKSNAVIGEILGISAHTVDAHLRKIYLKLGVFDRISAALRGLGFGLIHSAA